MKIFVDSDVIISSLISSTGAAFNLLKQKDLELFISNVSAQELEKVVTRMHLDKKKLQSLIDDRLKMFQLQDSIEELKRKYKAYVIDQNDAHIVAGAKFGKVKFLVTYNIKHFRGDSIKKDFRIIVTTPGNLFQYLRSLQ